MKTVITLFLFACFFSASAQDNASGLACREYEDYMLTHILVPAGPVPTVYDPNGVYPYISFVETSERPVLMRYRFINLENNLLRVKICPDLGGKVISIVLKKSNKEILYVPDVVKPVRILPRFSFVAGGIEVSFPISHSPSQNESVIYRIDRTDSCIYVTCGERELRFGMNWSVEYSLGKDDAWLTERMVYRNPGTKAYPWMSWSNAAVESAPDTRFYFPEGKVLSHASVIDTIDWKTMGPKQQSDIHEMTGYFWLTKDVNAFGVFTPSLGKGLYHIARESVTPGIKLWSYGNDADSSWSMLSTATHAQYLEIQGGPLGNQSIKAELQPGELKWHEEFWFPTDVPLDLKDLKIPADTLRPVSEIPFFTWARPEAFFFWQHLLTSSESGGPSPEPPDPAYFNWPPSGMENLGSAFEWAIRVADSSDMELWRYYYGAWLAGTGKMDSALIILSPCTSGFPLALTGRLLRIKGDFAGAAAAYRKIKETWLQLQPQVVIERDIVLRKLGKETLEERRNWLKKVNALNDEWIRERRVQLLIDEGKYKDAKDLLLSTKFQHVHQTYTRTELWRQITTALHEPFLPIPEQLGEDRLARFGAYREYE